jgi:hypothetical protein
LLRRDPRARRYGSERNTVECAWRTRQPVDHILRDGGQRAVVLGCEENDPVSFGDCGVEIDNALGQTAIFDITVVERDVADREHRNMNVLGRERSQREL